MQSDENDGVADAFVANILAAGADKGFRSLDVFVTWFVAGTAAAVGLAAANLEKLTWVITPSRLQAELPCLAVILLLVLGSKFLGSLICTMAGAMEAAVSVMRRYDEINVPIVGIGAFEAARRRAMPWPALATEWAWAKLTGRRRPNLGRVVTWLLIGSGSCALVAACLTAKFWISLLA